jgi:probable rRNA maturation factor
MIAVSNESGIPCDEQGLQRLAGFLLGQLGLHPDCDVAISLVDADRMTDLHVEWMGEPGPTDVLSFPMDELRPEGAEQARGVLGDIVLCPAYLPDQALAAGRTLDEELQFLVVHGMLHLIGMDHQEPEAHAVMFARQDDLLTAWGAVA